MPPTQQKNPYPAYDEEWGWLLDRWDSGAPPGTKLLAKCSKGILSRPPGDKGWADLKNPKFKVVTVKSRPEPQNVVSIDNRARVAKPTKKGIHPQDRREASGF